MNLTITRTEYRPDGIFSVVTDPLGSRIMTTLEHAYEAEDGSGGYEPKIPPGTYTCVRGKHRLHGMKNDFETFEVTGVPGHSGLLFHWGNWNRDSDGCILTGDSVDVAGDTEMITKSRATFDHFMKLQTGQNMFQLTVVP